MAGAASNQLSLVVNIQKYQLVLGVDYCSTHVQEETNHPLTCHTPMTIYINQNVVTIEDNVKTVLRSLNSSRFAVNKLYFIHSLFSQAENNSSLQFLKEFETPEHDAVYNVYLKKLSYNASRSTVSKSIYISVISVACTSSFTAILAYNIPGSCGAFIIIQLFLREL